MVARTNYFRLLLLCAGLALVNPALAQVTPPAVLTPTDAELRLWLRSDTLVDAGLQEGDPVTQWVDQSQYGTILSPRTVTNPSGPLGGFPVEENPHFQYVDINGKQVPSVRFDRDGDIFNTGDPNVDGSGSTDRLYQTNNLAPDFDPLVISDGSSFTSFIVFNPDVTTTLNDNGSPALGWQNVFGKRGTNAANYALQIKNFPNFGNFVFVSYDAVEQYHSGGTKPLDKVWHTTAISIVDQPGAENVDLISLFDDESQSGDVKMIDKGLTLANGTPQDVVAFRNPPVPEPFGMGGHSQNCCGEGETFAGNIAELIIFARTLTPEEFSDIEDYLDAKYFATTSFQEADVNMDGFVNDVDRQLIEAADPLDGDLWLTWQRQFDATGGAATRAIPEPGAIALCALALALLPARRRAACPTPGLGVVL